MSHPNQVGPDHSYIYGRLSNVYTLRQVVDVNFGDYIVQPAPEAHCRSIGEL